jgi:ABC-type transport system involved in cytochrome bd biosynthesis fused ATPase/permease subunit
LGKSKQISQSKFYQTLGEAWENLTLLNSYNKNIWNQKFQKHRSNWLEANQQLSFHKEFGSAIISFLGFIPILFFIYVQFIYKQSSSEDLVKLSLLLPRIFLIFNSSTTLVNMIKNFVFIKSHWTPITEKLQDLETIQNDRFHKIDFSQLTISSQTELFQFSNFNNTLEWLRLIKNNNGYYTITGPNGAGKSTLLLYLKKHLKDDAYYLPAFTQQAFNFNKREQFSTGQTIKKAIHEIIQIQDEKLQIICLDEWDANLDQKTTDEIMELLSKVAQTKIVIDIRH